MSRWILPGPHSKGVFPRDSEVDWNVSSICCSGIYEADESGYQNLTKGHTLGKEIADQCIKSRPILIEAGHLSINSNQMSRTMLESPVKAQTSSDVPIPYLSQLSLLM